MDGRAHLPSDIRQWLGDARGHWEGDTLVVHTTNFTDKTGSFDANLREPYGSGKTLHLIERFTRTGEHALLYEFTIDRPDDVHTSVHGSRADAHQRRFDL